MAIKIKISRYLEDRLTPNYSVQKPQDSHFRCKDSITSHFQGQSNLVKVVLLSSCREMNDPTEKLPSTRYWKSHEPDYYNLINFNVTGKNKRTKFRGDFSISSFPGLLLFTSVLNDNPNIKLSSRSFHYKYSRKYHKLYPQGVQFST